MEGIESGSYSQGEPLPSARQLSRRLNVDCGTVSRAFSTLEDAGVIRSPSPRTKVVNKYRSTAETLLRQSIAVLAHLPKSTLAGEFQPGWADFRSLGILDSIKNAGLHAITLNPETTTAADLHELIRNRPSGMLVGEIRRPPDEKKRLLSQLFSSHVAVVAYGDDADVAGLDRVTSDHESGAYQLCKWLLSQGRQRILFLSNRREDHAYWAQARQRGYKRAMAEFGHAALEPVLLPQIGNWLDGDNYGDCARVIAGHLVDRFARDDVDAIMCPSDGLTFLVASACKLIGTTPNEEVAITGYDNYWQDSPEQQQEPFAPVATVDKLNYKIGQEMVEMLLERVEEQDPDEPERRVIEPKLVVTGDQALKSR
jgi:DNA-binding LacI/PurR family transcriptional regulator